MSSALRTMLTHVPRNDHTPLKQQQQQLLLLLLLLPLVSCLHCLHTSLTETVLGTGITLCKLESALCGDANPRRLQRQSCCG